MGCAALGDADRSVLATSPLIVASCVLVAAALACCMMRLDSSGCLPGITWLQVCSGPKAQAWLSACVMVAACRESCLGRVDP